MSIHSQGQKRQIQSWTLLLPSLHQQMVSLNTKPNLPVVTREQRIPRDKDSLADSPLVVGPGATGHSRPVPVNQHQVTGYTMHGIYGPSSPLNMSSMAYSLPSPQSHSSPFEPHMMHQYASAQHAQGMVYPMQSMGHYTGPAHGGGVPYGIPYAPAYGHYPTHQHPGALPHGSSPYYGGHPPMQNMGHGPPIYPGSYYPHTYPGTYGAHPRAGYIPTQSRPQTRPGSSGYSQSKTSAPKKAPKQQAEVEYDVVKTIVDGSNPSKLAQELSYAIGQSIDYPISWLSLFHD